MQTNHPSDANALHEQPSIPSKGFVAVHVGAGLHAAKNKARYLNVCRKACQMGIRLLKKDPSATATMIVEQMIRILEDDPVTNAGLGSNLNLKGHVECDASIMNGTTLGFGSVGAITDFKNPISVAQLILQKSDEGPLSLGRIPPIMLTGSGATQWYHTMGFNHLDRVLPELPNSIVLTELKKLCTNHNTNTDTDADNNNNCNTNSSNSNNDVKNSNNNDNNNDDDDGDDTCSLNGSLVTRESLRRYAKFSAMLTASHPQKSLALQATSTLTQPGNSTINTSTLNNDIAVHNPESSSRPPIPETQAVTMMMKRKASIGRGKEEEEEEEEERDKVNKRSSSYLKQPPQHQQQQQQQQRQQQQQHQNLSQPKYGGNIKQVLEEEEGEEINDLLQDTVGAICVDSWGRVAAGVSSGGIAMKFPGRVSEAALYGTGCWAQDPTISSGGFACSMTGAGEQISKTLLARTCMDTFLQEDDIAMATTDVLDRFIHSPLLKSYEDRYAGFIAVKVEPSSSVAAAVEGSITNSNKDRNEPLQPLRTEFVFAHTTKTMGIAYMSANDNKPTAIMSERKAKSNKSVFTKMIKL